MSQRSNLELYRSLIESSPDAVWECDRDFCYRYLNPRAEQVFEATASTLLGTSRLEHVAEPDRGGLRSQLEELPNLDGPTPVTVLRILTGAGKEIRVETGTAPLYDSDGALVGFCGVDRLTSSNPDLLSQLEALELKFRRALEASSMGVCVYQLDSSGQLVLIDINPSAEAFIDRSRETVIGKRFEEIFPSIVNSELPVVLRNVAREGIGWRATDFPYSDASIDGIYDINLFQPAPMQVAVEFLEVSERTAARTSVVELKSWLKGILQTATNVAFIVTDAEPESFNVLEFSPGAEKIFGFTRSEIIGTPLTHLDPPNLANALSSKLQGLLTSHGNFAEETDLTRRDGQLFAAWRSTYTLQKSDGKVYAFLDVIHDISEKRDLETRLRRSERMESLGALAGGIAHAFNNILTGIMGSAELALQSLTPGQTEFRNVEQVLLAAKRAHELVQQILRASRHSDETPKMVNLGEIVSEALILLRASIPRTVEIRTSIETGSESVKAVPVDLLQILLNLSSNAAYAMRKEGGVLEIKTKVVRYVASDKNKPVDLEPGRYQRLEVVDTGEGIPIEAQQHIFESSFTSKEEGQGTGLGLSVVRGIVSKCGGSIDFESNVGQGTKFVVHLPIANEVPKAAPAEPVDLQKGSERILFVDDEMMLISVGRQMLEHLGYQVTTCSSGEDALSIFQAAPQDYDLVITDQTMPGMTGITLTERLKKIRADARIVLCTGYSQVLDRDKIRAAGVTGIIEKPVRLQSLAATLRSVFEGNSVV